MNFADGMKKVIKNLDALLAVSNTLTPEAIDGLNKLAAIDWDNAALMTGAHNQMIKDMTKVETVLNGMRDIKGVLDIQNQVKYVSDIRQSIGLVAGSIDDIKKAAEYATVFGGVQAMQPMLEEVLALSVKMDAVLDLESNMDHVTMKLELVETKLANVDKLNKEATKSAECAANMLNEIKIREKVIDEKLKRMEGTEERMGDFSVSVDFVDSASPGSSSYNKLQSTLTLAIPKGKRGDKGDSIRGERGIKGDIGISRAPEKQGTPGERGGDGKNFKIDIYGTKREIARFGNRPVGTSFLSLDESPTMIYFRRSNTLDDWTEGQPFGISDGGLNIDDIAEYVINEAARRRNHNV